MRVDFITRSFFCPFGTVPFCDGAVAGLFFRGAVGLCDGVSYQGWGLECF